jgi:hypothetical protein
MQENIFRSKEKKLQKRKELKNLNKEIENKTKENIKEKSN